jgi:hypothetical protein
MSLSDIIHLSTGRIVVQAFLSFVVLQLWVSILHVVVVHLVPSHDASFKWYAALRDLVTVPNYFIFLSVLAFCATLTTLHLVVSIAQLPFARARDQVHRAFYRFNSFFTSISLCSQLLRTYCTNAPDDGLTASQYAWTWRHPAGGRSRSAVGVR